MLIIEDDIGIRFDVGIGTVLNPELELDSVFSVYCSIRMALDIYNTISTNIINIAPTNPTIKCYIDRKTYRDKLGQK